MSELKELTASGLQKVVSQKLDSLMAAKNVPKETREMLINSLEMIYEYISYARKLSQNPSDGKALRGFLATKAGKMAKFLGNDPINCGVALVEFLGSTEKAVTVSRSREAIYLPVPVLAWGLAALDLIEVGNSCEYVQEATYHVFLKNSSPAIDKARAMVGTTYVLP